MFHFEYSNYSPETIINDGYNKMAEMILEKASTDDLKEKLYDIIYKGGFNEFTINLGYEDYIPLSKDSPFYEGKRRIDYAYFFANNPEMLNVMEESNAILLHGTKIDALPSILKYGLNSFNESMKNGIEVSTGEEWSRLEAKRSFISFTNSLSTAIHYSSLNNREGSSSFGIILGISPDALKQLDAVSVPNHMSEPEIGIKNHIPLEYIKTITVPKEKVDFVQKLVGDRSIEVLGADIEDKFYSMNNSQKQEYLEDPESFKETKPRDYDREDMQKVAKTRILSRIRNFFNKGKENRTDEIKDSYSLEER